MVAYGLGLSLVTALGCGVRRHSGRRVWRRETPCAAEPGRRAAPG